MNRNILCNLLETINSAPAKLFRFILNMSRMNMYAHKLHISQTFNILQIFMLSTKLQ